MMIIDPPAVMYGPPAAIQGWLDELATMPKQDPEVKRAIKEAKGWLNNAQQADTSP